MNDWRCLQWTHEFDSKMMRNEAVCIARKDAHLGSSYALCSTECSSWKESNSPDGVLILCSCRNAWACFCRQSMCDTHSDSENGSNVRATNDLMRLWNAKDLAPTFNSGETKEQVWHLFDIEKVNNDWNEWSQRLFTAKFERKPTNASYDVKTLQIEMIAVWQSIENTCNAPVTMNDDTCKPFERNVIKSNSDLVQKRAIDKRWTSLEYTNSCQWPTNNKSPRCHSRKETKR